MQNILSSGKIEEKTRQENLVPEWERASHERVIGNNNKKEAIINKLYFKLNSKEHKEGSTIWDEVSMSPSF